MTRTFLHSFFFFIALQVCFAQGGQEEFNTLLSETEAFYKQQENYTVELLYAFYEEGRIQPLETLDGQVQKNGKNYYSKIGDTEFVYLQHHFIKISHSEKSVLYSKIKEKQSFTPIDLRSLESYFKSYKVTRTNTGYVCELEFISSPSIPYSKMVLVINKGDYSIKRQELHLMEGKQYPWLALGTNKTKAGKMVISFSETKPDSNPDNFRLSKYINDHSNTITLSKNLQAYQLYNTTR